MIGGGISPPPLKRRRLDPEEDRSHSNVLTVYSWNINGIGPFLQPSIDTFFPSTEKSRDSLCPPRSSLRTFLQRHGWPELLFLQEVKIRPDDRATVRAVENAVRRQKDEDASLPDYIAHFCLPSDKHNARGFGGKIYGVCSVIRRDFARDSVRAVRHVDWDVEGRVLVLETTPTGRLPQLAIFNIYAVNGTDNAYKDPITGAVVGTRHDRKLQFHRLLQSECMRLEKAGISVIIAGDINIARSTLDGYPNLRTHPQQHVRNRDDFEERFLGGRDSRSTQVVTSECAKAAGLRMIDTFRACHPSQRCYSYYPRNKPFGETCDRVDMIIASKDLASHCVDAGMHETPADRGPSDHVPIFARFDFDQGPAPDQRCND